MHSATRGCGIVGYNLMAHFMEYPMCCVGGADREDFVELKSKGGLDSPGQ